MSSFLFCSSEWRSRGRIQWTEGGRGRTAGWLAGRVGKSMIHILGRKEEQGEREGGKWRSGEEGEGRAIDAESRWPARGPLVRSPTMRKGPFPSFFPLPLLLSLLSLPRIPSLDSLCTHAVLTPPSPAVATPASSPPSLPLSVQRPTLFKFIHLECRTDRPTGQAATSSGFGWTAAVVRKDQEEGGYGRHACTLTYKDG